MQNRLLKGFSANVFGQAVNILIQLVSVPILLDVWGIHLYGEWLILSIIPSYLVMSDIGFSSVAANEMTMEVARNNTDEALKIFQSVWFFITTVCISIFLLLLLAFPYISVKDILNLNEMTNKQILSICLCLTLYVFIKLQGGMVEAGFRSDGNYALGTLASNLVRLLENLLMLASVYLFSLDPLGAALILLFSRVIGFLFMAAKLKKISPWLEFGYRHINVKVIKDLSGSAVAFMGFPLGYAFLNQGMATAVALNIGAVAVVTFTAIKTLSRIAFQLMVIINGTVWPEVSIAYGKGDISLARRLHRYSCKISILLSVLAIVVLLFVGEPILGLWTNNEVEMDFPFFAMMLAAVAINSLWLTSSVVPSATNQHHKIALLFSLSTFLSVSVAIQLAPKLGLTGIGFSILLTDLAMTVFVVKTSLKILDDSIIKFLRFPF